MGGRACGSNGKLSPFRVKNMGVGSINRRSGRYNSPFEHAKISSGFRSDGCNQHGGTNEAGKLQTARKASTTFSTLFLVGLNGTNSGGRSLGTVHRFAGSKNLYSSDRT